jgi:hypothetical protein
MAKSKKSTKPKKLTEFPVFNKLAPELREMIWGFALPEANTVEIWVSRKCQVIQGEGKWEYIYELHASYTVPAILQTSQESRAIAKKFYKKIFEGEFANKPIVWFNQFQDVLWLRYSDTLTHLCTLRGFKVLSFYTAVNPPVFDAPVVNVRRLQFNEAWNAFLQPHMKQILVAFGKPELLIRHKPSSGQKVWDAPFHLLEMQIKKWGTGDDDADADYKPEVHFLTKFQLQKFIVSLLLSS